MEMKFAYYTASYAFLNWLNTQVSYSLCKFCLMIVDTTSSDKMIRDNFISFLYFFYCFVLVTKFVFSHSLGAIPNYNRQSTSNKI